MTADYVAAAQLKRANIIDKYESDVRISQEDREMLKLLHYDVLKEKGSLESWLIAKFKAINEDRRKEQGPWMGEF
ncbi:MAG: hypothetical protein JSS82_15640 [Bacteroidetes bacterium]|nr:hypothetical protein [Bacteroidota bacterium]